MKQAIGARLKPWVNWRRKRFWLLAALLAWTLFGFLAAPPLLERQLKRTVEATGRAVSVADIQINPFVLSVRLAGLEVLDADEKPIVRFEELFVNFQLSSIYHWAWTFDEIRIAGLHLEEERFADGSSRLLRLSTDLEASQEKPTSEAQSEQLARVIIHQLVLEDGSIGVTDQLAGGFQEQFGPVSVTASDLRTLPDHAGENQVSIVTPEGGVISWKGDLSFVPLTSSGQFTVRGKGLPVTLRYLDYFLPISIEGEEIEIDFDYSLQGRDGKFSAVVENVELSTGGIHVRMDGTDETFVELAQIRLSGGVCRFPERTASVESLAFDGLAIDAWLDKQGQLSLLDALPVQSGAGAEPGSEADGDLPHWDVSVDQITVADASIDFEDRRLPTPAALGIQNLALSLKGVNNHQGTRIPAEASFDLASGGVIYYSGSVTALPGFLVDGHVSASEFGLPLIQPWLAQRAHLQVVSGSAEIEADITGDPTSSLAISGSLGVNDLEVSDTLRTQSLAALQGLEVERFELDMGSRVLRTSPVDLRGAYGRLHIYQDLSTNLDGLVVEQENVDDASSGNAANNQGLDVTVAGIEVEDGALDFADDSLPLPFSTAIRNMGGHLSTLSTSSSEPSTVSLEGQVNEYGEARIEGALNPWDFTQSADIRVAFRNLQMSNLTPYTIQYAGYEIDAGRLDLDLAYKLQQRKLEGENKIVIRELVLGDKVENPEATSLPLKLAVALLTDSEGVIDIDLPVAGDLDDPTFKISGIVWKAIGNLITKIVTSPFRFLAGLVGVDSEDFGTLRFEPGQAAVSPPDREQLLKLAEAMGERPELSLVVTGVFDEALDAPALRILAFESHLEARRDSLLESGEAQAIGAERTALESMFTQTFPGDSLETVQAEFTPQASTNGGDQAPSQAASLDEPAYLAALRERLVNAEEVGEVELQALAAERAIAVFKVLEEAAAESAAESYLAVSIADSVERTEGENGEVALELEVTVQESAAITPN